MSLDKNDLKQITAKMDEVARRLVEEGRGQKKQDTFHRTERRLYAYPVLKKNIERYLADIEDIKHEDMGKSADIVLYQTNSGKSPEMDLEELRAEKIFTITEKLHRDRAEVEEIEAALEYIRGDKNYEVIPMTYFERKSKEEICRKTGVSSSTLWRICCRLIRDLELVLYGASALK